MTKEQALAILKQPGRIGCTMICANDKEACGFNQESIEALEMAIKALEQQPSKEDVQRVVDYLLKPISKSTISDDCISRQAMLDAITEIDDNVNMDIYTDEVREIVNELPPVSPTHGVCKYCARSHKYLGMDEYFCDYFQEDVDIDFYCKHFDKRGNEE